MARRPGAMKTNRTNVDYACSDRINRDGTKLIVPETVTVVGTGGFGAWVAIFAARAGVERLVLINPTNANKTGDREDIAGREIAIGPFNDKDVGRPKVDALKELIAAARPQAEVVTYKKAFDPGRDGDLLSGVVFAGVSNLKVYRGIWHCAQRKGLRCFGGVYSGTNVGVLSELPETLTIGRSLPVWVGSAALAAALAVHAAFVRPITYRGDLSELDQPASMLSSAWTTDADL